MTDISANPHTMRIMLDFTANIELEAAKAIANLIYREGGARKDRHEFTSFHPYRRDVIVTVHKAVFPMRPNDPRSLSDAWVVRARIEDNG